MIDKQLNKNNFDACCSFFKVLGDPTRMKLILALLNGPLCVNDLTNKLNMEQSAISHQLKLLKKARVLKSIKKGKNVFYSFDDQHVEDIISIAIDHLNHKNSD